MKVVYSLPEVQKLFQLETTNMVWSLVRKGVIPEPVFKNDRVVRWLAADIHKALGVDDVQIA